MKLDLVKTEKFHDLPCDFYKNEDEMWMTRQQIGQALEYDNPADAIYRIHERHKDRLDRYSTIDRLTTLDGKSRKITLYNELGIFEICRWSRQPKANEFMDWAWKIIKAYRHGQLRTGTPVTTVEQFLTQQMEIMNQMHADSQKLYNVTSQSLHILTDLVKQLKVVPSDTQPINTKAYQEITAADKESIIAEYRVNEWKAEVYRLVNQILNETSKFGTARDVLSATYRHLTNAYGIVWEQARKEYKGKYGIETPVSTIDVCYDRYPDYLLSSLESMLSICKKENGDPDWEEMKIKITNYANHIGNKSKGGTSVYRKIYTKMTENGVNWDEYAHGLSKSQLIKTNATLYNRFYEAAVEIISEE